MKIPLFLSLAATALLQGKSYVLIVVDDLGYMDIGAYNPGSFYETPNVDRLAKQGLKFTDGYAANPVCSPTRFGIQTGRYPTRKEATNFFGGNRSGKFAPARVHHRMDQEEVTIAEALKEQGYATFYAGKWHLGPTEDFWPENQGYDVNAGGFKAGGPYGGKKYFSPYGNPRLSDGPDGEHLPDRLATDTCKFMEANKGKPFFAMLSFYSVHTPLIGRPDLVAKYKKKAAKINGQEFSDEEQVLGDKPRKVRILQKHAVYAAMVEAMDQAVGKVIKKVEELGLEDEVVICFTSDNGGLSTSEGSPTSNLPLRGGKGWIYEGGIREPFIVKWPGVTKPGQTSEVPVMSTDFFPTFVKAAGGTVKGKVDGVDLLPILKGGELEREALYWHYPHYSNQGGFPSGAIRIGDWKLLERYEDGRVHLFNLKDDIGELNDVKEKHAERVTEMRAKLHAWYREVDAKFLQKKKGQDEAPWKP
ncbi:MAG: sulfatase [Akkermansiaceae bacterium]|jgi:arylsulfatase A-like enzyme|tara:strand:+ start:57 stop:1478 length:1422 start_codon:yes stop_codon:yes gene_type:complete